MPNHTQLLKIRAQKLARVLEVKDSIKEYLEVLVFKLAQEHYALETTYVKEVYLYKDYTPLPCVPPFIFGLINVRRKILSILDLKVFFSLPTEGHYDQKAIIVEHLEMEFAILTDGVIGIKKIYLEDIQPSLPTFSGVKQEFLKGITLDRIVLLNGEKLIGSKLILVNDTVEI